MRHITLMTTCLHFQKRLTWFLSSIVQQIGDGNFRITVIVDSMKDEGTPTTEEVCSYFNDYRCDLFNLIHVVHKEKDSFAMRGQVRTDQMNIASKLSCKDDDLMIFVDVDHCFERRFFVELNQCQFTDKPTVYSVRRISTDIENTCGYFDTIDSHVYPSRIYDWRECVYNHMTPFVYRNAGGYGNFQCITYATAKKLGFKYVENNNRDNSVFDKFHSGSDVVFRKRIGSVTKLNTTSEQYHINHRRDPDYGRHLMEQR